MRFLFVVHKNEEKAEQNSVLFHRLTLKERGLRPNGYFPLMRQPLNTYILSIRVFVRKVKISFHLLFSCDKVFLSIFRKHRKRYFLHHKRKRPPACHAQSLLLRFSGSRRRAAAIPSQSSTYMRRFLESSKVRPLVSFC